MGYSARRGFTSGSMKATGAARQAEMQQKIAQMQEQMNAAQEAIEAKEFTASVGGGVVEAKVLRQKEHRKTESQNQQDACHHPIATEPSYPTHVQAAE